MFSCISNHDIYIIDWKITKKAHFSFTLFNFTIIKDFYVDLLLMFNRIFNKGTQKLVHNKGVCLAI